MATKIHKGQCQCGAVAFTAHGTPIRVANCHCNDCRKATGAAFTTFVDFLRSNVLFSHAPAVFQSSPDAKRLFCSACGTPIGYRGDSSPDEINLYVGAFSCPGDFTPTQDEHQESAL